MSKRKRDVSFIKPDEPAFIARMKAQAGYKEGPTVDTKREALSSDEDIDDQDDELPQVVVLREGDLTAEEASKAKEEQEQVPANLEERVLFRKPDKKKAKESSIPEEGVSDSNIIEKTKERKKSQPSSNSKHQKKSKSSSLLSFNEEEEEEEEEDE